MTTAARQQLVEQALVELQDRVKEYEDRQQRLLQNINAAIYELVDKASKQRGARGQDMLSLHHFFATHLASAVQQLEGVVDAKLKSVPHTSSSSELSSNAIVALPTPELESRLAIIESKLTETQANPVLSVDIPQVQQLEQKLQQLEANTVQELRRIHQTTFKPGDYGTPLNQLQQKVSQIESQVRSIQLVDSNKLAEATIARTIIDFRKELETALGKYVSAEDLFQFRAEVSRLDELVVEAQTRSHVLLQKSAHIEEYVANMLGQYKAAALRMEESIMLEYQKFDRNLEKHYRLWCQKQFDVEFVNIRAEVLERSHEYFEGITDKVSREQATIFDENTKRIEQRISVEYANAKRNLLDMAEQMEKLDRDTRERVEQQYSLTQQHITHSRAIFSELTLSVQKTVQKLYEDYSIQESKRLDGILAEFIQKIVEQWDSVQRSIDTNIFEKIDAIEKLRVKAEQYIVNSEEIIKTHILRFEEFINAQTMFVEDMKKQSEILISSTAEFVEYQKDNLYKAYNRYAHELTDTVDKKLGEVAMWDERITMLARQYHEEVGELKKNFVKHMNDFEEYMNYSLNEKAMTMQTLEKMLVENQSKYNEYISEQEQKNEARMKAMEGTFFNMFLETQTRVEKVESSASRKLQELQQYTPQLEVLLSNRLQDIQTQAQEIIDENHKLLESEYYTHQKKINESMKQYKEKMENSIKDYLAEQNKELREYNLEIEAKIAKYVDEFKKSTAKIQEDTQKFREEATKRNEETVYFLGDKVSQMQEIVKASVNQSKQETAIAVAHFENEFKKSASVLEEQTSEIATAANRINMIDNLSRQFNAISGKLAMLESISFKVDSFQQKSLSDTTITEQRVAKLEKLIEKQQDTIIELLQKQSEKPAYLRPGTQTQKFENSMDQAGNTTITPEQPMEIPKTTPRKESIFPKAKKLEKPAQRAMSPPPAMNVISPMQSLFQPKNTGSAYRSLTKCFFTAIFGVPGQQTDRLPSFVPIPGWDAVCFTNQDIPTTIGWTVQKVEMPFPNPSLSSKYYKWMSHLILEDYDVVVWMDAYLAPDRTKSELLENWINGMYTEKKLIAHRPHAERNCIYDECDAVIKGKRDTPGNVDRVRKLLISTQMPKNKGLFDTNIMIKFHKDKVLQDVCRHIFNQLERISNRDQLAITLQYFQNKFTQIAVFPLMEAWQKRGDHVRLPAF